MQTVSNPRGRKCDMTGTREAVSMTRRGTSTRGRQRNPPAETSSGTTRRRAETRQRLMDAAYEVFAEYSIRDAPTELICDRAGFTRGAFYSNFSSKEDLFLAVFDQQLSRRVEGDRKSTRLNSS